jgi:hypothetical protein
MRIVSVAHLALRTIFQEQSESTCPTLSMCREQPQQPRETPGQRQYCCDAYVPIAAAATQLWLSSTNPDSRFNGM